MQDCLEIVPVKVEVNKMILAYRETQLILGFHFLPLQVLIEKISKQGLDLLVTLIQV